MRHVVWCSKYSTGLRFTWFRANLVEYVAFVRISAPCLCWGGAHGVELGQGTGKKKVVEKHGGKIGTQQYIRLIFSNIQNNTTATVFFIHSECTTDM